MERARIQGARFAARNASSDRSLLRKKVSDHKAKFVHCLKFFRSCLKNAHLGDANDFMKFFLNTLHQALNGSSKTTSSIVYKTFRGRMRQHTKKVTPADMEEAARSNGDANEYRGKYRFICARARVAVVELQR